MEVQDLRIVFMGTPEFAVTILDKLVASQLNVVGVVTTPDKPAGRGQKLHESAVKQYAVQSNLPVLQPEKLKADDFLQELAALNADVFVVVAFRMLPEVVWAMPPKGTFNLHGSLLPQYRGAAPINWAIINGESKTGVTSFFLTHEIDTGSIILQREMPIGPNETAGELHDRMMHVGADVVYETLELIATNQAIASPQDIAGVDLKHAPKIFRPDCRIDWTKDALAIHNQIRGLSPYPAAWTEIREASGLVKQLKLFSTEVAAFVSSSTEITFEVNKDAITVHLPGRKALLIHELQLEGKRRMTSKEFSLGFDLGPCKINSLI
jgi:methionyl-tRNA formyltransferase